MATSVSTTVDVSVFGEDALHRTCYAFTGRCHLRLERLGEHTIKVSFAPLAEEPLAQDIVAQFENALFDHRIRADLHRETATIRDLIYRQAFVEADL